MIVTEINTDLLSFSCMLAESGIVFTKENKLFRLVPVNMYAAQTAVFSLHKVIVEAYYRERQRNPEIDQKNSSEVSFPIICEYKEGDKTMDVFFAKYPDKVVSVKMKNIVEV